MTNTPKELRERIEDALIGSIILKIAHEHGKIIDLDTLVIDRGTAVNKLSALFTQHLNTPKEPNNPIGGDTIRRAFPISTFSGETQNQLVRCVQSLVAEREQQLKEDK